MFFVQFLKILKEWKWRVYGYFLSGKQCSFLLEKKPNTRTEVI